MLAPLQPLRVSDRMPRRACVAPPKKPMLDDRGLAPDAAGPRPLSRLP